MGEMVYDSSGRGRSTRRPIQWRNSDTTRQIAQSIEETLAELDGESQQSSAGGRRPLDYDADQDFSVSTPERRPRAKPPEKFDSARRPILAGLFLAAIIALCLLTVAIMRGFVV